MLHDLKFGSYADDTISNAYGEDFEHMRKTYG